MSRDYEDNDSGRGGRPSGRMTPHSIDAEEALLGAVILSRNALEVAIDLVVPNDFYSPNNALIFEAAVAMYQHGEPIDATTLSDKMRSLGTMDTVGGPERLIELMAATPATSNAARYAKTIADFSVVRKVIGVALEAAEAAYAPGADPSDVVESAYSGFAEALSGITAEDPEDLWILDDFLDQPLEERPGWIIPGLLRKQWRGMMVAGEGSGKTVLLRQIGILAAQGIHPLNFSPMDPIRVLIVDLENPEDSVHDVCGPLRSKTESKAMDYDRERTYFWHRPGGINLRGRKDKIEFENVIAKAQPDLVLIGPLYKAYSVSASEADEQAAKEVMQCFDDLRTRYGFALLMEHHAPKGSGSSKTRDLLPYGSSLWLRWPELGLKMTPVDSEGNTMKLGRWRGDRLDNAWPSELVRGGPGKWMWEGKWPDNTFNNNRSEPANHTSNEPRGVVHSSGAPKLISPNKGIDFAGDVDGYTGESGLDKNGYEYDYGYGSDDDDYGHGYESDDGYGADDDGYVY